MRKVRQQERGEVWMREKKYDSKTDMGKKVMKWKRMIIGWRQKYCTYKRETLRGTEKKH